MKRLFQLGTILMLIGAFYPLLELFDRWDPPGPSNDTEFAVYGFILSICLVLLLCKLIFSAVLAFSFVTDRVFLLDEKLRAADSALRSIFAIPPLNLIPLRI